MSEYKDKRYALVFGASIEGAGVTRTGVEMQYWCKKNGVELDIYSYDEKSFVNKKSQAFDYTRFTKDNIDEITKKLNEYDVVIFNSYPLHKFDPEAIKAFYERLMKGITTVKVGFVHDVKKVTIDKIPYLIGIMNQLDKVYTFSTSVWLAQNIAKMLPSKQPNERLDGFNLWFNFELLEDLRNEYTLDKKDKKMLYIGRNASHKDTPRILNIGNIMMDVYPDFKLEMKGIYKSIDAKVAVFDHPNTIDCTNKSGIERPNERGFVRVSGPFNRDEGMQAMAGSLFGCSFFTLPKEPWDYGDRMEYTQMEIIALGSIPVFDKHWAENNRTSDGRLYIDIPYSAIYSDKTNLEDTVDQLLKVAQDPELQEKYREASYEIAKQEFDASNVLPKFFDEISNLTVDSNKFATDEEMLEHITNSKEFAQEAKKLKEQGEIVVMGVRELTHKILCILKDKKEKQVLKIK